MTFFDIGAIIYYASIISWEFPDFSVDHCLSQLTQLDQLIQNDGSITTKEDRFILVTRKMIQKVKTIGLFIRLIVFEFIRFMGINVIGKYL